MRLSGGPRQHVRTDAGLRLTAWGNRCWDMSLRDWHGYPMSMRGSTPDWASAGKVRSE
jgi:hypothetical protein